MANALIGVEGMNCNHCKMSVEKTLKGLPGVSRAEVSLEKKNVSVEYNPQEASLEAMKEAIIGAGYGVK